MAKAEIIIGECGGGGSKNVIVIPVGGENWNSGSLNQKMFINDGVCDGEDISTWKNGSITFTSANAGTYSFVCFMKSTVAYGAGIELYVNGTSIGYVGGSNSHINQDMTFPSSYTFSSGDVLTFSGYGSSSYVGTSNGCVVLISQ